MLERAVVTTLIGIAGVSLAAADFIQLTGDLQFFVNTVNIPGPGSDEFVEPSAADRADFGDAIAALLRRDFTTATTLADNQGYDLIEFSYVFNNLQPYYILRERGGAEFRGLGTYVFNPASRRTLNIQAPHVPSDIDTGPESVEMFVALDAVFLQITGTHRCANDASSPCDGTTATCGASEPHRVSDAAHFTRNFFQVASDRVAAERPGAVALQIHAFPVGCGQALEDTPLAQISNTACSSCGDQICHQVDNSLCTQIALEINSRLDALDYPGVGAVSWNATPADPAEVRVPGNMCTPFCGNTNTQGRSLNGAADPCEDAVTIAQLPERFVHIEQLFLLTRGEPGGIPHIGISRQVVIDAIADVFPAGPQLWVDFDHFGPEFGTFNLPFNTIAEGVNNAPSGATIRIRSGSSAEAPVISSRVTLRGFDGQVTIGN